MQIGKIMERKKLGMPTRTINVSVTNGTMELKDRISGIEDTIDEIGRQGNENIKFKMFLAQNMQEIRDIMKRLNQRIIGMKKKIPSPKAQKLSSTKVIEENVANLQQDMSVQVQKLTEYQILYQKKIPWKYNNQNQMY